MKVVLTQEQFSALIEYIDATIADAKFDSDLHEAVRKRRAMENLENVLLADNSVMD